MASNTYVLVPPKSHNFTISSVLCDIVMPPPACPQPLLWSCGWPSSILRDVENYPFGITDTSAKGQWVNISVLYDIAFLLAGDRCELDINECNDNPCMNGGNCTNYNGSYLCDCTLGYDGTNCTNANCSHNQCENGGTCEIQANKWNCNCPEFVEGEPILFAITELH